MRKIVQYLFFTVAFLAANIASASDYKFFTYANLLTHQQEDIVKIGAQAIHNHYPNNTELNDLAAFILHQSVTGQKYLGLDTQSWLAKAIGKSGNGRYKSFMSEVLNSNINAKLAKYAKQAYKKLPNPAGDPFNANTYDINGLVNKLAAMEPGLKVAETGVPFGQTRPGDSIETVFQRIGVTRNISITKEVKFNPWTGSVAFSLLQLNYPAGTIAFSFESRSGNTFRVKTLSPNYAYSAGAQPAQSIPAQQIAPAQAAPAQQTAPAQPATKTTTEPAQQSAQAVQPAKATQLAQPAQPGLASQPAQQPAIATPQHRQVNHPLLSSNAHNVKPHVQQLYRSRSATQMDLDAAAERLYMDMYNDQMVDTMAWICRLLGQSSNPRYRTVLLEVMQSRAHKKLRKYAKKAYHQVKRGEAPQYLKGAIFLQQN